MNMRTQTEHAGNIYAVLQTTDLSRFRNVALRTRTHCVVCEAGYPEPVIRFPQFPLTEIYVPFKATEKLAAADQVFQFCDNCGHAQLANVIDPRILYSDNYATRTSSSSSARVAIDTFLSFVDSILRDRPVENIVDIGCNDLYALQRMKHRAPQLLGIDPMWQGKNPPADDKIHVVGDFMENVSLRDFVAAPDVVLCSHTLEHVENPKALIGSLLVGANASTLFFFQFPALEPLVHTSRFDHVHHQHLNYFSLKSTIRMLDDAGAELVDFKFNHYHWGALMIAFRKKRSDSPDDKFADCVVEITSRQIINGYALFRDSMNVTNRRIASLRDGRPCYGFGAALMLPLLNYYVEQIASLECIFDDDPGKQGLYYINVPLKIVSPAKAKNLADATVVVTAINSKQVVRAILSRLIHLNVRDIVIPGNLI